VLLSARVEARQAEMALNDDELSFSLSLSQEAYTQEKKLVGITAKSAGVPCEPRPPALPGQEDP
jgi:hypothetical protein